MAFWFRTFVMIFLLTSPLVVHGQALGDPPTDSSRFVLFIHAGSATASADPALSKKIAVALATRGYVVRAPDDQRDLYGPGVDYFADADLAAAQDIAAVINSQLPKEAKQLQPRRQRANNPSGYIGVWLFE